MRKRFAAARPERDSLSNKSDVTHAPGVAVATAVFAVLAAIASLVDNKTAAQSLAAKNEAIISCTQASDASNSAEAHLIREQIYEAALAANPALDAAVRAQLTAVARQEAGTAKPFFERAKLRDEVAATANDRAALYTEKHDLFDGSVTLLEIAIAVISISTLTSSRYLIGFGGLCATAGVVLFVYAFVR